MGIIRVTCLRGPFDCLHMCLSVSVLCSMYGQLLDMRMPGKHMLVMWDHIRPLCQCHYLHPLSRCRYHKGKGNMGQLRIHKEEAYHLGCTCSWLLYL